jgi:hypothetical protein
MRDFRAGRLLKQAIGHSGDPSGRDNELGTG